MTAGTRETLSAFARRCGVHRSSVTRWAQDGRLVLVEGQVEVEASLARLEATQDPARDDVRQRHAAARAEKQAGPAPRAQQPTQQAAQQTEQQQAGAADLDAVTAETGDGRKRYKALTIAYENQAIKLEMALRRGMRYARRGWVESVGAVGGVMRAGGERLIDQGAPSLALLSSDAERLRELLRYVARYRAAVKREFPRALRRQRTAATGAA